MAFDEELGREKLAKVARLEHVLNQFPQRLESGQNVFEATPFPLVIEHSLSKPYQPELTAGHVIETAIMNDEEFFATRGLKSKVDVARYLLAYCGINFTPQYGTSSALNSKEVAVAYEYTMRTLAKKNNQVLKVLGNKKGEIGYDFGLLLLQSTILIAPSVIEYLKSPQLGLKEQYKFTGWPNDNAKMPITGLTYLGWINHRIHQEAAEDIIDMHLAMYQK